MEAGRGRRIPDECGGEHPAFSQRIHFRVAPSQIALRGLTAGFGLLLVGLLLRTGGSPDEVSAPSWVAALSVLQCRPCT